MNQNCTLCTDHGGELLVQNQDWRVILIDDADYPGFCRVVWNAHVAEMTDLLPAQRSSLMQAVCKVEQALREVMQPHKINLASLGNMVPHLHWHVIPRYTDDAHFPNPIWGERQRSTAAETLVQRRALLPALRQRIIQSLL